MLTQIDVDSENAFKLPIFGVTPKDSLLVRSVTGLNPPDINLFIGDYARDGGYYQGRRVGNRNVVIVIDLNPNPALGETIQGWRDVLYKAFVDPQVDGDFIRLVLHDDLNRQRYLVGYTEKFETSIFDSDQSVQISIICPDPYLRDVVETLLVGPGGGWITLTFEYTATAETGFEVELPIINDTPELNLMNNGRTMTMLSDFQDNQIVYINTNRGARNIMSVDKSEVLERTNPPAWSNVTPYPPGGWVFYNGKPWMATALNTNQPPSGTSPFWVEGTASVRWQNMLDLGLTTPLISSLLPSSRWLELHSQSNVMNVFGENLGDGKVTISTLSYRNSYWGI